MGRDARIKESARIASKQKNPIESTSADNGFALLTVIWGIGLVSLLILLFTLNVRTQTKLASNSFTTAELEAAADAGVNLAILNLVETAKMLPEKHRFPHDGEPVLCHFSNDMTLQISVHDEEGKVDLNTAGEPLLRALMEGLGTDTITASRHVDALMDFRDSDSLRRVNGAERREYREAGKNWWPNDAPFHAVDELHRVLNLPADLVERLMPLVTVYSHRGGVDPRVARPELVKALSASDRTGARQISPAYAIISRHRTFAIRVKATHSNGGAFVRQTSVELKPGSERLYQLHSWRRGELSDDRRLPYGDRPVPEC